MSEIIVATDGFEYSLVALEWAAAEAVRRDASLRIVCVAPQWVCDADSTSPIGLAYDWKSDYERFLDRAAERAHKIAPKVEISHALVPGQPAAVLLKASEHALMVVMAARGDTELTGLLMGTTVSQVVSHATCPVAVVPPPEPAVYNEVVVGVDGSSNSQRAIDLAFQEASLRKARLRAVHAWRRPLTEDADVIPLFYDLDEVVADEKRLLAESLSGRAERYPDVEVIEDPVHARPVRALAGASARADLLVVGSRGRGGFAGLALGSVSHAMLSRAHCPLMIVPDR